MTKKPKKTPMKVIRAREKRALKRVKRAEYELAKRQMFERDKGCCVFCGSDLTQSKHFQTCHIIPKFFKESKADVNNMLLACFYHHKGKGYSMHQNPLWFICWLREKRPEQYNYLMEKYWHLLKKFF